MMNYGGSSSDDAASTNNNDAAAAAAAASRWENMLVGNYFGGGGGGDDIFTSHDDSAMTTTNTTTAATYDPNDRQGYATACHLAAAVAGAGFPRHHGNHNGTSTTTPTTNNNLFYGYHAPAPAPTTTTTTTTTTLRNGSPYSMFMTGGGSGNGSGSGGGGQQSHLPGGESSSGCGSSGGGLYHHNPQFDLQFPATAVQQQNSSTSRRRRRQQHEDGASATSHTTYDQYSTNYDHGNYYNPVETTRIFDRIVTDDANSGRNHHHHHPQQHHRNNNFHGTTAAGCGASPDDINLNEMEYCDALLRGVGDSNSNFSWLENVFTTMNGHGGGGGGGGNGGGGGRSVANNTNTTMTNDSHSTISRRDEYSNCFTSDGGRGGISGMLQLFNEQNSGMMGGADERLMLHGFGDSSQDSGRRMMSHQHQQQQQTSHKERTWGDQGDRGGGHNNTALDAYIVAQLRQQQKQLHLDQQHQRLQQRQHHKETTRPHTSHSASEVRSSRSKLPKTTSSSSAATAATTSSSRLPSRADHSSLPSAQIDPILERISLTVTAVSLTPMSGNEVVRHIRNKTDDVITRFLPCVDFLVNCQQELRQGLALAQQQQQQQQQRGRRGASRNNTVITPRQFHTSYVAPLPNRFKRQYEPIMASEHLHHALRSLESLVKDAAVATPQGIDHVKNAFLGGMRENQSWGLRKWLSEHGGAGSICNDVEEVMRHVKALKREEETTKRLAEMLRPIARQAHDRLKKDVPSAYQEKSSAHPYLPFFHRLESCLKQMATYDPEEDDVICLEDSDDEDEDVTVLSDNTGTRQAPVATTSRSPVPNRPTMAKDSFISKWADSFVEGGRGNDAKRSRLDLGTQTNNEDPHVGEQCEKADRGEKGKPKEPEVICLVDSDDEGDESDSLAQKNEFGLDFGRLDSFSPPPPLARNNVADAPLNGSQHGASTETSTTKEGEQWRCVQCTFLNEAFSKQCVMCNDDDSANGANSADDLANFLGGGSFLLEGESCNHSFNGSDQFLQANCLTPTDHFTTGAEQHKWRALQSADARELECLAEHISGGGSLPNQAHMQTDQFWAKSDTFPQILLLFRSILQHPTSYRFLEPVNETQLFMMGSPEYTSIVKHPLCFHEIVSALSRSEDAVKHPYLTMRLSNGKLAVANMGELEHWNMWNGLHLIEAIDLVLLNSLAYNGSLENSGQVQIETESLRDLLWEGVNSMLKRLQPHRRRDHLPQRRSVDSGFVVVKADRR